MFSFNELNLPDYTECLDHELEYLVACNSILTNIDPIEYIDDEIEKKKNRSSTYNEQEKVERIYELYQDYIIHIKNHIEYLIYKCKYHPDDLDADILLQDLEREYPNITLVCIDKWYERVDKIIYSFKRRYYD